MSKIEGSSDIPAAVPVNNHWKLQLKILPHQKYTSIVDDFNTISR